MTTFQVPTPERPEDADWNRVEVCVRRLITAVVLNSANSGKRALLASLDTRLTSFRDLSGYVGPEISKPFWEAFRAVQQQLVERWVTNEDAYRLLITLLMETAETRSSKADAAAQHGAATEFVEALKSDLVLFEVAFAIQYLDTGDKTIDVAGSAITPLHDRERPDADGDPRFGSLSVTDYVSMVRVRAWAAGYNQAVEVARDLAQKAVARARVGASLADQNWPSFNQFRWRWTGEAVTYRVEGTVLTPVLVDHGPADDKPLVYDMAEIIVKGMGPDYADIAILDSEGLGPKIVGQFDDALRVFELGLLAHDERLRSVMIATAFERLLAPDYFGGHKGELIAIRHCLITGTSNPVGILNLYEGRSDELHGSGHSAMDPELFFHAKLHFATAFKVLARAAVGSEPHGTLKSLISGMETSERLERIAHHINEGMYGKTSSSLRDVIARRIEIASRNADSSGWA